MDPAELMKRVPWRDASFDRMEADYDEVRVFATDAAKRSIRVRAISQIAVTWIGHWDESILESVEVSSTDPAIARAIQGVRDVYGEAPSLGGGLREISGPWHLLRFRFIDGATLEIIAQRVEVRVD